MRSPSAVGTVLLISHEYYAWKLREKCIHRTRSTFGQPSDNDGGVAKAQQTIVVSRTAVAYTLCFVASRVCKLLERPHSQVLALHDSLLVMDVPERVRPVGSVDEGVVRRDPRLADELAASTLEQHYHHNHYHHDHQRQQQQLLLNSNRDWLSQTANRLLIVSN